MSDDRYELELEALDAARYRIEELELQRRTLEESVRWLQSEVLRENRRALRATLDRLAAQEQARTGAGS